MTILPSGGGLIQAIERIELLRCLVFVADSIRNNKPDELRWIRQQFHHLTSEHSRNLMRDDLLAELSELDKAALDALDAPYRYQPPTS